MKKSIILKITTVALVMMAIAWPAVAQNVQKPKYAADVPEFLLTPDKVETEVLGTLDFFDGIHRQKNL